MVLYVSPGLVQFIGDLAQSVSVNEEQLQRQSLVPQLPDQGFVLAGFPANNFGGQEPGSNEEIGAFCRSKFGVTFPMFSKISVKRNAR